MRIRECSSVTTVKRYLPVNPTTRCTHGHTVKMHQGTTVTNVTELFQQQIVYNNTRYFVTVVAKGYGNANSAICRLHTKQFWRDTSECITQNSVRLAQQVKLLQIDIPPHRELAQHWREYSRMLAAI